MRYNKTLLGSLTLLLSASVMGHGLMSDPAARNWLCGAVTKPDTAEPGSACAQAFEDDFDGGYSFMSVLTHDVGRAGVTPLPDNVCGFDSETWDGGATPWDKPIDWPTNAMSAGEQTITWNISWGPHFGDTEEFRYWITKPGFEYQVGEPLSWDDFESEAFCVLNYDDANPNANPDVVPDKDNSLFHTTCDVPERSGRHVIYGEWGRNEFTYERFHGCVDAQFDGGGGGVTVVADIVATPDVTSFTGPGEIAFDGSSSQGENLSYQWSLEAADTSGYSLSSTSGSSTVLSLPAIEAQQAVTVRLQVSGAEATSSTSVEIAHAPEGGTSWQDLGALTGQSQTLNVGDEVSVRLVEADGTDVYLPAQALVIDSTTTAADAWPYALAQAVNAEGGDVRVGVLADGSVTAAQSATDNRVYTSAPDSYTSAFLDVTDSSSSSSAGGGAQQCNWYGTIEPVCENTDSGWGYENGESCVGATTCADQPDPYGLVDDGGSSSSVSSSSSASSESSSSSSSAPSGGGQASCEHSVENEWGSGFTASVTITNNGDAAINGWEVEWSYADDVSIGNSWNADFSGSNPFTATDAGHNATIEPGESASFGFQASGSAGQPDVTGRICQ